MTKREYVYEYEQRVFMGSFQSNIPKQFSYFRDVLGDEKRPPAVFRMDGALRGGEGS